MQLVEARNNLAHLIALRIVDDREMVVDFLRTRTDYDVQDGCSNGYLASVLSDMTFDEKSHEKLSRLLMKDVKFVNFEPISTGAFLLYLAIIGTTATTISAVRGSQEARESAISGLTLQQVDYDKQMIENRARMSKDFFANILKNEREIQEQKRQVVVEQRRKDLIYLVIFIGILTASFALIIRK
tara:strand:+ start:79 stop:633 length:555 start_codon:yes stop_codon:yes gene_type:complete